MLIDLIDKQTKLGWSSDYLDHHEERQWRFLKMKIKMKIRELQCPWSYEDVGEWAYAPLYKKNQAITAWMKENGKK